MNLLLQIALPLLGLSALVIAHESGHYLAARAFGMRVLRFSIGLGKPIAKWQPKGSPTVFQIAAIPFLAYVEIDGMNPFVERDAKDSALFANKSVFARIVTILAGPLANYICACLLLFGLLTILGGADLEGAQMRVKRVQQGSPAALAGVQPGDLFVAVNGTQVASFVAFREISGRRAEQATHYTLMRAGHRQELTMTPRRAPDGRGILGVEPVPRFVPIPPGEALERSFVEPLGYLPALLNQIGSMFRRRTTEGLTGPFGMWHELAKSVEEGAHDFWGNLISISLSLCFLNLLPFPALDGGRLVFLGYELVARRKPNEKLEAVVHTIGILFLLSMILMVSFRDIRTWFQ